jgi:hypothetical protein
MWTSICFVVSLLFCFFDSCFNEYMHQSLHTAPVTCYRLFLCFIISLLFVFFPISMSADSSVQSASTAVSTADATNCSDLSQLHWGSTSDSTAQDDTNTSVTHATFDTNNITNRLDNTNFGFAITSGSTIDGIVVEIDKHASAGSAVDYYVQLFKAGSLVGTNKADTSTAWAGSDTDTYTSYGSSSDVWGTTWTESDIENTGFGVAVCAQATANNTDVQIDHIRITVHYTLPDSTAPADTTNLAAGSATASTIKLTWTAPGDDGSTGTATTYDIRYSTADITTGNWSSATTVTGEPSPSVAGSSESYTVTGLSASTLYYFALKTSDEVPNESGLSNVPSLSTTATPDTIAPGDITDLTLSDATASSIKLSWTAPGDDGDSGTADSYDVRYSTSAITDGNWASATAVTGEPSPAVASSTESMTISSLSAETTYFFAIKTSDEAANESELSNIPSLATSEAGSGPSIIIPDSSGGVGATDLVFSGQAYPGVDIEILQKDDVNIHYVNVPVTFKTIESDGMFNVRFRALLTGQYFFSLRAIDADGRKTSGISFPVDFKDQSGGFSFEDIVVPPTVGFDPSPVVKGKDINILGYAPAESSVELELDGIHIGTTTAEATGAYTFVLPTSDKEVGTHAVRARWIEFDEISPQLDLVQLRASGFSSPRSFKVSTLENPRADFNNDNAVTIADWSIFLFRWGSKEVKEHMRADMNDDGKVNISDLSIFLKAMKI